MKQPRVLVLEDDLPFQRHLRKALQHQGLEVFCESSLIGARRFLRSNEVDLLLLDLFLPDGCGYELFTGTQDVVRGRPVFAMVSVFLGSANAELLTRLFGFRAVLPKPIDNIEHLLELFGQALGSPLAFQSPSAQHPHSEPMVSPVPTIKSVPTETPVTSFPTSPPEAASKPKAQPPSPALAKSVPNASSSSQRAPSSNPRSSSQRPAIVSRSTPSSSNPRPSARRSMTTQRTIQRATASSSRLAAIASPSLASPNPVTTSTPSSSAFAARPSTRGLRSERRILRDSPKTPLTRSKGAALSSSEAPRAKSTSSKEAALSLFSRTHEGVAQAFGFDFSPPPQQGRLDTLSLPLLLACLAKQGATGSLLLRQEKTKKIVYLQDGVPVAVKSNLLPECLGRLLVREGKISQEACDTSFERLKAESRLQGHVLLEMGVLRENDLQKALEDQFIAKIKDVMSWDGGLYQFRTVDAVAPQPYMSSLRPEEVIVFGIRGSFAADRALRDLHTEFEQAPVLLRDALDWESFDWDPQERALLHQVDGEKTLYDVVTNAADSEQAQRLMYALVCLGALGFRQPKRTS